MRLNAWIASGRDGAIPADNPKFYAAEHTMLALTNYPFPSLTDAQRKATFFLTNKYLSDSLWLDCWNHFAAQAAPLNPSP